MKIRVIIEFDSTAESFAAYCPELPGCASCGDTEKEALRNFKEALKLFFEPAPFRPKKTARVVEMSLG
jgi:predicted RNase H-like HicB family nuclease